MLLQVAEGVWRMPCIVPWMINTYLVHTDEGDVLIDAGTRWVTGVLLRGLRGRRLRMVALTHVHPDHQGAAREVCVRYKVPLACHEADAAVMEGRGRMVPPSPLVRVFGPLLAGPPHRVSVRWQGDETLGEWRIVATPGHTPGHVSLFRERDGVAIVGDLLANASMLRGMGTLSEPPHYFSTDSRENRRSMKRLMELKPTLMLFGHGPPSRDIERVERFVRTLGA